MGATHVAGHVPRRSPGERAARTSMLLLAGVPGGVVFLAVWEGIVKTSATLGEEERVRGWASVARELPATLLLLSVVAAGLVFAVRAGRLGAVDAGLRAIRWHAGALFLVLLVLMSGAAEDVMTTRSATVKWLLVPVEIGLTAVVGLVARRAARPS